MSERTAEEEQFQMASLSVAKQQLRSAMKQKLGAVTNELAQSQSRQRPMFSLEIYTTLVSIGQHTHAYT